MFLAELRQLRERIWRHREKAEEMMGFHLWKVPSRELTYPTLGKGKSSSKMPWWGIC